MMSQRKPGGTITPASGDPMTVLDLLEAGIWDWNVVTGEIYLSPAWKRQLGYRDHELTNDIAGVGGVEVAISLGGIDRRAVDVVGVGCSHLFGEIQGRGNWR